MTETERTLVMNRFEERLTLVERHVDSLMLSQHKANNAMQVLKEIVDQLRDDLSAMKGIP